MKNTTRMTVELPAQLKDRLEEIAKTTSMSSAILAVDAINSYVELQEWQIQQIQAGSGRRMREISPVTQRWRRSLPDGFFLS